MGSYLGIINKHGKEINRDVFKKAISVMNNWQPDYSGEFIINNLAFGAGVLYSTPEGKVEKVPYYDQETGCCIVADTRLDYREELIDNLALQVKNGESLPDTEVILYAYYKYEEDCVRYLFGDFAFAIWDPKKEILFCARDHFGIKPFVFYESEEFIIFSSELRIILSLPYVKTEIREEMIVESLLGLSPAKDLTLYRSIYRLTPAHYRIFPIHKTSTQYKYWELDLNLELTEVDEDKAIIDLRKRFEKAVQVRCKSEGPIGIELSEGLDSSSIASKVTKYVDAQMTSIISLTNTLKSSQKVMTFPYKIDLPNVNELNTLYSFTKQIYLTGEGQIGFYQALENACLLFCEPQYHGMSSTFYPLFERAQSEGINVIFSGFGGDEGVTSGAPGYFEELIRKGEYNKFKEQLKYTIQEYGGNYNIRVVYYCLIVLFPWIRRIKDWINIHLITQNTRYRATTLSQSLRLKHRAKTKYFRGTVLPLFKSVKERQYFKTNHTHITDRLEEFFLSAQSCKIAYRFPFFDVKLLEYYYSLPSDYKKHNGYGRWIFRKAMEDALPKKICWRKRKLIPVIPYGRNLVHDDELKFRKLINESRHNNQYHYIDYGKLERVMNQIIYLEKGKKMLASMRIFRNSICVLHLQKWQREGKIDIGIKY